VSLRPLFLAWCGLILLLTTTVAASYLPIGAWRQVIALTIAGAKAALVLWIFMEFRRETTLVRLVAAVAGALLFIMTLMLAADDHLRPWTPTSALPPARMATAK
jgi:cytochrome c oxidase subunit 4